MDFGVCGGIVETIPLRYQRINYKHKYTERERDFKS
jgi:hypothetical protein